MNGNKEKSFFVILDDNFVNNNTNRLDIERLKIKFDTREEAIQAAKDDQTDEWEANPEGAVDRIIYVFEVTDAIKFPKPEIVTEAIKNVAIKDLRNNPSANQIAI